MYFIVLEIESIADDASKFLLYWSINCRNGVTNLSFSNIILKLNVLNMCKRPYDKKNDDSENVEIDLIEPIIEEHV